MTDNASFAGFQKHETLQYGLTTKSGISKIKIINAVANHWKHRSERVMNSDGKRQKAIEELFDQVEYFTDIKYPV